MAREGWSPLDTLTKTVGFLLTSGQIVTSDLIQTKSLALNLPLNRSSKLLFIEAEEQKWGRKEFGALVKRRTNISDALFLLGNIRRRHKMFSFLSIPDIPLHEKEKKLLVTMLKVGVNDIS